MNNKSLIGLSGTGKCRSPTKIIKYQNKTLTNLIIFLTDDKDNDDEQIRSNNSQTL